MTVRRLERAEAEVMRTMVQPLVASARAPNAFFRELDAGLATYVRPGSPFNKVIGAGLTGPIELDEVERRYFDLAEPVRIEIATLAAPEAFEQLAARGYQLHGFENVLGRSLRETPSTSSELRIEPVQEATRAQYRHVVVEGTVSSDDTGVVLDQFTRSVIETVLDDFMLAPDFARYLAYRSDAVAGGASMRLHEDVAVFTGSATLVEHRRRGVQAALLARRLEDARTAGAQHAIITTAPGTQSQANVMKAGFSLLYARAVLVLAPR